jgi:RecA-family ATPase
MAKQRNNPNTLNRASKRRKKKPEGQTESAFETISARELKDMDFPPLKFAVEGVIAEGLTLLTGKPKMGKSWMALELGMAVARGDAALGSIQCEQGLVLYAALEDNVRRLQRRMETRFGKLDEWPSSFVFITSMNRLDEGLLDDLENWINEHQPKLVIIDTFVCIKPSSYREAGYSSDYASLAPLQELAGRLGVAIVVVHHLRKMQGDDPFDMISGTTGLTGAVDAALVLARSSGGTTLYGRGRDIEEIEFAVDFGKDGWTHLGNSDEVRQSSQRKDILKVITEADGPIGPKKIANALGKKTNAVKQLLRKMVFAGEIKKLERGRYVLASA